MLNKLAISGIKHRLRDYSVLFSGLTISAAIFYMFMALATNKSFTDNNSPLKITSLIFGFGIVLLSIITFVYLIYANSFLMSMRQREYGMFMMLGARSSKIGRMIFVETFMIGTLSTVIGVALGVGLTETLSQVLIKSLYLQISHFNPFYLKAVIYTLAFFIVIFALAAMRNSIKLRNTNVLKLLNSDKQPTKIKRVGWWKLTQAIIGIGLLSVSYYLMINIGKMARAISPEVVFGLLIVTTILGTYFVINSFFSWIIKLLKNRRGFSMKKLNNFTLSQLGFRISDYTRILAMVSMLFALALGAITVGIEFKDVGNKQVNQNSYYDVVVHNPDTQELKSLKEMDIKTKATYDYKITENGKQLILNSDQFKKNNLAYQEFSNSEDSNEVKTKYFDGDVKHEAVFMGSELWMAIPDVEKIVQTKFVNSSEFNKVSEKNNSIMMVKSTDFYKNLSAIKKISQEDVKKYPSTMFQSKYENYIMVSTLLSGLEFMGIFLGIAFLAMLASCLMFKILSGAASDVKRYEMLHKMGVRDSLLSGSINKEIGVLFLIPGAIGVLHVVMGLQLSKLMLPNPYEGIAIPFIGFFVLYLIYYFVTTILYKRIVLKK